METNAAPIKKAVPNAGLEILPDMGHLPFMEAPEQVNKLLREFFSISGTLGKKMGLQVESAKREDGQRVYTLAK